MYNLFLNTLFLFEYSNLIVKNKFILFKSILDSKNSIIVKYKLNLKHSIIIYKWFTDFKKNANLI